EWRSGWPLEHERRHGRVLGPQTVVDAGRPEHGLTFVELGGHPVDARESATLDAADERIVRPGVRMDLTVLAKAEKCERQVVVAEDGPSLDIDEGLERPRAPVRPVGRSDGRAGHARGGGGAAPAGWGRGWRLGR